MTGVRKRISVMIPTYNECENVEPISRAVRALFDEELSRYELEILFIDNASTDGTRERICALCAEDARIKAIFNARNFGQFLSPFYGICQATGDCVIPLCADFQDPVSLIPTFVEHWERGCAVVCGVKEKSREGALLRAARTLYYKLIRRFSSVEQIEHFTGFGLYDRRFVDVLRKLDDPTPFLRGVVAELGFARAIVPYTQEKRKSGRTKNNFATLYDAAMHSFATYTRVPVRAMMVVGVLAVFLSVIGLICAFLYKSPLGCLFFSLLFLFGVNAAFLSVLGEYLLLLRAKVIRRPLVIEECRLNFSEGES